MKRALAFSGGKDSWACLWLHEHELDDIHVIWVNTGKNYPELLKTIARARAMCPHFVEVKTDRDAQNKRSGLPSDIVPIDWTAVGQHFTHAKPTMVQSYLACCMENLSRPLHDAVVQLGCTHLIRGQRLDESHKSSARHGDVVEGIVYLQPIEDWTREQVLAYLRTKMELPEHFKLTHSSMDCYDCTAYRAESNDRVTWMRERHPDLFIRYYARAAKLKAAIAEALSEGQL